MKWLSDDNRVIMPSNGIPVVGAARKMAVRREAGRKSD